MGEAVRQRVPDSGVVYLTGVYPAQNCADPELSPQHLLANSDWRIMDGRAAVTDPQEGDTWETALCQADKGWLSRPSPFDEEG